MVNKAVAADADNDIAADSMGPLHLAVLWVKWCVCGALKLPAHGVR